MSRIFLVLVFFFLSSNHIPLSADELTRRETVDTCFVDFPETMAPHGGADCGYIVVPQDRTGNATGEVQLAYMRIQSVSRSDATPLFMLAGGPGKSIIRDTELLLFQPELLGGILAQRDVVLMEQRGTFWSRPSLDCPEVRAAQRKAIRSGPNATNTDTLELEALHQCIARLSKSGVDLSAYNSAESAADVNDARTLLGYKTIHLYGASYGTLLAQFIMRQFPEALESVVLNGYDPVTNTNWVQKRALSAQWGLENLTKLCASQPGCAEAYDIPGLVDQAFSLFDEGPIESMVTINENEKLSVSLEITAEDFADVVYELQTSRYGVMAMPAELTQMVSGGRELIATILGEQIASALSTPNVESVNDMPIIMHMAMVCTDDPPRSLDDIELGDVSRYARIFALSKGKEYIDLCNAIPLRQLPNDSDITPQADIPVLVFSGGLDVQTPVFLSEEFTRTQPNVQNIIFPAGFHAQISNLNRCAMKLMQSFLHNPEARLDLSCVDEEQPLSIVLPQDLEAKAH